VLFEMDADLSHDPKVIPQFLSQIEQGADFVIGSRYIKGGAIPPDWGLHRKVFSVLGNIIIRLGFMKLRITDWTSGYRAIRVWIVKDSLSHIRKYSGYVFQVALLDFALKNKAQVKEVPIIFTDRRHGKSKINSVQYIIHTLFYTFFHSSFVRYVLVGLMGFVIDFGLSYLFIERLHSALWLATLISAETAILSNFMFNNFWSFSHKRLESKASTFVSQFVKFNLISSGSLAIQAGGMELLGFFFGRKWWFIYKVFIIGFIIIPYSYILYNRVVWKEK
jgi:dolichol-phosphate mannosyltransferase